MTKTTVKKSMDRGALEAELLGKLRQIPECHNAQSVSVGVLERPALSNWTVVNHNLGEPRKKCVCELARIMSDLQQKYRLNEI